MEAATLSTMSRVKAATTELSAVWTEVECLKAENIRLQKDWPKQAAEIDWAAEVEQMELYALALQDIQAKGGTDGSISMWLGSF